MGADDPPDTPRAVPRAVPPPRPIPTLATVQTTVEVCVGHLKALRLEVDALGKLIREPTETIRISAVPTSVSLTPPPPRPSIAAKAASGTSRVGKWILIGTGALSLVTQGLSMANRPELGPIVQALKVLLETLGGAQ